MRLLILQRSIDQTDSFHTRDFGTIALDLAPATEWSNIGLTINLQSNRIAGNIDSRRLNSWQPFLSSASPIWPCQSALCGLGNSGGVNLDRRNRLESACWLSRFEKFPNRQNRSARRTQSLDGMNVCMDFYSCRFWQRQLTNRLQSATLPVSVPAIPIGR